LLSAYQIAVLFDQLGFKGTEVAGGVLWEHPCGATLTIPNNVQPVHTNVVWSTLRAYSEDLRLFGNRVNLFAITCCNCGKEVYVTPGWNREMVKEIIFESTMRGACIECGCGAIIEG